MRLYVTLENGKFKFIDFDQSVHTVLGTFEVDDLEGIRAFFREHRIEGYQHSSSLDWPEDEGFSEDFDPHAVLKQAGPLEDPKVKAQIARLSELLGASGDQATAGLARDLFFDPPNGLFGVLDLMLKHFPELAKVEG